VSYQANNNTYILSPKTFSAISLIELFVPFRMLLFEEALTGFINILCWIVVENSKFVLDSSMSFLWNLIAVGSLISFLVGLPCQFYYMSSIELMYKCPFPRDFGV
jgi:hypothetical protein